VGKMQNIGEVAVIRRATKWGAPGVALSIFGIAAVAAAEQPSFVQNGKAGFVVAEMQYALAKDASENGACPEGMTQGMSMEASGYGAPAGGAAGQRPAGAAPGTQPGSAQPAGGAVSNEEAERQFLRRLMDPSRPNACVNPEKFGPDPKFMTVKVPDIKAYGIDLDGKDSRQKGKPAPGTCAHTDLLGMNGERGIDNQFYRLVGCSGSYQSTGQGNTWTIEMHTGSWGVLITLGGVDDIRNDDNVQVTLAANGDPIELSPNREPLWNATYAMQQDPRFRSTTRGRLKDGVLTTEPMDVRIHKITNGIYLERTLKEARVQMTLSKEGVLEGYLAGYTPVEDLFNFEFAYRNGKNGKGEPADRRLTMISATGRAATQLYSCNGVYYALQDVADGHPDPATGKCTSISTQYRIKAIPAFVVDTKTESLNEDLERR